MEYQIDVRYSDNGYTEAEELIEAHRSGRLLGLRPVLHVLKRKPYDDLGKPRSYDGQISRRWLLQQKRKGADLGIEYHDS